MPSQPEGRLVEAIRRAISRKYPAAWTFKVAGGPYQTGGVPDVLVCVNGILVGIEVKARRAAESEEHALARVTLRQQAALNRMAEAGAVTGVALSVHDALEIVALVAKRTSSGT